MGPRDGIDALKLALRPVAKVHDDMAVSQWFRPSVTDQRAVFRLEKLSMKPRSSEFCGLQVAACVAVPAVWVHTSCRLAWVRCLRSGGRGAAGLTMASTRGSSPRARGAPRNPPKPKKPTA